MGRFLRGHLFLGMGLLLSACTLDSSITDLNSKNVDYSATTLSVTSPGIADGVTPVTITIVIRNRGIPVPSFIPSYTVTGTGNNLGTCTVSNASGVSTCLLRSTTSEVKIVALANPVVAISEIVTFLPATRTIAERAISSGGGILSPGAVRGHTSIGLPVSPIVLESDSAPGIPRARVGVHGVLYEP